MSRGACGRMSAPGDRVAAAPGAWSNLYGGQTMPEATSRLAEWVETLPTEGEHTYVLAAPLPLVDPEEAIIVLYVGVSRNLRVRFRSHAKRSWWWPLVDPDLTELQRHPDRRAALDYEADLIRFYQPPGNRAGVAV